MEQWILIICGMDKITPEDAIGTFPTQEQASNWGANHRPDEVSWAMKLEEPIDE